MPIDQGPDTISILLTTDNHVGYLENDPVRGDDSWRTFREITLLAKLHNVDMMVQGGDLFHVTRPLKKALFHVIDAIRSDCLGDRPCELELLSDPAPALRGNGANYEDPNINVLVPIFAISGNHDDATGDGMLLPLDVLSASGLLNYFGQAPQQDSVAAVPLVFQKGTTRLALYGINNMRDERLHRIMRNGNVTFQKPKGLGFFNLLCIHQNHASHSPTSFVPEEFLPSFLDFVFWGHEHECIPQPQRNPQTGFDTLQAGSSVATSLSEGETAQKHVFIMNIKGMHYSLEAIPLRTVRPFLMRDVSLAKEHFVEGPGSREDILTFLVDQVEQMVKQALAGSNQLPLVRLRVDRTGDYEVENARRFSNKFVGKLANVDDILIYHRRKTQPDPKLTSIKLAPLTTKVTIQGMLEETLKQLELYLIPEKGIADATKRFIEQDDRQVFSDFIDQSVKNATALLLNADIDEPDTEAKQSFKELLTRLKMASKREESASKSEETVSVRDDMVVDLDEEPPEPKKRAPKARAKPAPRAARAKPAPKAAKAAPKPTPKSKHDDFLDILAFS